jgi:hypothetical protein
VTVSLDVYDVTNSVLLGTLSEPFGLSLHDDLRTPGMIQFSVDVDSSADIGLLQPRRVVRWREGGSPGTEVRAAGIVDDFQAVLSGEVEPSGGKLATVTFRCPLLTAWLGFGKGGAVLEPYRGLDGLQQNPRPFGWMSFDYNDVLWPAAVEFTRYFQGGPPRLDATYPPGIPEGFPDPDAVFIASRDVDAEGKHPAGTWYQRRKFDAPTEGVYGLWFAVDGRAQVYVNGELVLNTDRETVRTMYRVWHVEVSLLAGENLLAVSTTNAPGGPTYTIWTVATMDDEGEPEFVIARSSAHTRVLDFPATVPGVTVGWVSQRVLAESKARGELPSSPRAAIRRRWTLPGWRGPANSPMRSGCRSSAGSTTNCRTGAATSPSTRPPTGLRCGRVAARTCPPR